jgi:hypothetical protein
MKGLQQKNNKSENRQPVKKKSWREMQYDHRKPTDASTGKDLSMDARNVGRNSA